MSPSGTLIMSDAPLNVEMDQRASVSFGEMINRNILGSAVHPPFHGHLVVSPAKIEFHPTVWQGMSERRMDKSPPD